MGSGDHRCEWRDKAEKLEAELRDVRGELASMHGTLEKLQRHVFGKRSEKITPLATAIRDPARAEADRIATLQTRRENAEKKRQLVTRKIEHKVREDQKACPKCGGHDFSKLGEGAVSELYEPRPRHRGAGDPVGCVSWTCRAAGGATRSAQTGTKLAPVSLSHGGAHVDRPRYRRHRDFGGRPQGAQCRTERASPRPSCRNLHRSASRG
jgi:hypothetical protein